MYFSKIRKAVPCLSKEFGAELWVYAGSRNTSSQTFLEGCVHASLRSR
jgi:hypothetical protein